MPCNIKKWQEFLADLDGKNEDGIEVEFDKDNRISLNSFQSGWISGARVIMMTEHLQSFFNLACS